MRLEGVTDVYLMLPSYMTDVLRMTDSAGGIPVYFQSINSIFTVKSYSYILVDFGLLWHGFCYVLTTHLWHGYFEYGV